MCRAEDVVVRGVRRVDGVVEASSALEARADEAEGYRDATEGCLDGTAGRPDAMEALAVTEVNTSLSRAAAQSTRETVADERESHADARVIVNGETAVPADSAERPACRGGAVT